MAHFPQPHSAQRAPRIRITRQVPITITSQNARAATGLLATISRTGGLALLPHKFPPGSLAEISFKTPSGTVTSIAEMLQFQKAQEGFLQAFRHIALGDEEHIALVHGMSSLGN